MKKFFISHMKNFDSLGKGITLKIEGEYVVKSTFGGILTILLWLAGLTVTIFNFTEFLSKKNPRITEGSQIRNGAEIVNLPKYFLNFTISISVFADVVKLIPLSISNTSFISQKIQLITPNFIIINENIGEVVDCYDVDFISDFRSKYSYINYSNCVGHKIYNDSVKLEGDVELLYEVRQKFTTDLCSAFEDKNCKKLQFYESLQYSYAMSFIYGQIVPDMNAERGYSDNLSIITKKIDLSKDYVLEMIFTRHIMYTDNNVLFNIYDNKRSEFFTVNVDFIEKVRNEKDPNLMNILTNIRVDNKEIIHNRSYLKLDEMLANIFSIYTVLAYFTDFLYNILHYNYLEYKIMNNVYRINSQDKNTSLNSENKKFIQTQLVRVRRHLKNEVDKYNNTKNNMLNLVNINNDNNIENDNNNNNNNNNSHNNSNDAHNTIIYDFNSFQLRFRNNIKALPYYRSLYFYKILPLCFRKKRHNGVSLHFKMEKILKRDLDVVNLIKNSIKVEQMIKILFDNSQEHCFKLLVNRLIDSSMKTKKILHQLNLIQNNTEDFINIFDSYNKIQMSDDVWDKQFISYLNKFY